MLYDPLQWKYILFSYHIIRLSDSSFYLQILKCPLFLSAVTMKSSTLLYFFSLSLLFEFKDNKVLSDIYLFSKLLNDPLLRMTQMITKLFKTESTDGNLRLVLEEVWWQCSILPSLEKVGLECCQLVPRGQVLRRDHEHLNN